METQFVLSLLSKHFSEKEMLGIPGHRYVKCVKGFGVLLLQLILLVCLCVIHLFILRCCPPICHLFLFAYFVYDFRYHLLNSSLFLQIVSRLEFPYYNDEVHHTGWNACSSCYGTTVQRRYLVIPCLHTSRIYVVDCAEIEELKLHKVGGLY